VCLHTAIYVSQIEKFPATTNVANSTMSDKIDKKGLWLTCSQPIGDGVLVCARCNPSKKWMMKFRRLTVARSLNVRSIRICLCKQFILSQLMFNWASQFSIKREAISLSLSLTSKPLSSAIGFNVFFHSIIKNSLVRSSAIYTQRALRCLYGNERVLVRAVSLETSAS
jgi:hypothetical protein